MLTNNLSGYINLPRISHFGVVVVIVTLFTQSLSGATKTDNCEYDIDLTNNKMKIVCEGAPARGE